AAKRRSAARLRRVRWGASCTALTTGTTCSSPSWRATRARSHARAAVSELLERTRFGFIAYPLDFIGKSSVFAAYSAHGVVPIVLSDKHGAFDGLQPVRHFLDGLRLGTGRRPSCRRHA